MRQVMMKLTIAVLAFVIGLSSAAMFGNSRRGFRVHKRPAGCMSKFKSQMSLPPVTPPQTPAPLAPVSVEAKLTHAFMVKEKSKDGKTYRTVEVSAGAASPSR